MDGNQAMTTEQFQRDTIIAAQQRAANNHALALSRLQYGGASPWWVIARQRDAAFWAAQAREWAGIDEPVNKPHN